VDIWSDDDLDQMERRIDYALGTEDDGKVLLVPPQSIKEPFVEFRRMRAQASGPDQARGPELRSSP
jgi:hypothetical protein